ncbi:NAD-dependent epimerase/dehydratase family protein [Roseimaritima sediminicola]|uniref:NAD-dependent epimerase/dehydratase family protein n=1 Tax=Roseimaritima sediminicola TaxID=2662066 RepID=UPI0012982F19|nr:NAD(P)-dependent oxidoreductase [Roseimaritima sediminicola]
MTTSALPDLIENESQLDALLARPSDALVERMGSLEGDLIICGVGGKMGVSLAQLALAAIRRAGVRKTVYGVSRFSSPEARRKLDAMGVKTIACDLLDRTAVAALPQVDQVVYMAGRKFGTGDAPALTWAMNTLVPANVADHFRASRIVAFSTGCVYPLARVGEAPDETVPPAPVGEYAQSCLGRERMFEYASETFGTPVCLFRLNYAIDLRYGVLFDIADKVWNEQPVNNGVEAFNVIWQGDANQQALLCLGQCSSPANVINVTGPETLYTEAVARRFGELFNKPVRFATTPSPLGYLSDSGRATALFGEPSVTADQLIRWQAHWIRCGGRSLGKPTHFEVSDGGY